MYDRLYLNLSTVLTALLTLCSRLSVGASSNEVRTELIGRIREATSNRELLITHNWVTITCCYMWSAMHVRVHFIHNIVRMTYLYWFYICSLSCDDASRPFITTAVSLLLDCSCWASLNWTWITIITHNVTIITRDYSVTIILVPSPAREPSSRKYVTSEVKVPMRSLTKLGSYCH